MNERALLSQASQVLGDMEELARVWGSAFAQVRNEELRVLLGQQFDDLFEVVLRYVRVGYRYCRSLQDAALMTANSDLLHDLFGDNVTIGLLERPVGLS